MQRSVTPFLAILGVLTAPLLACAQAVSGQAKDLQGKPVVNVNVEVLSSGGATLASQFFGDGNYKLKLPPVADNDQGVQVRFTSTADRVPAELFLNARTNHAMDITMPLWTEMPGYCQPSYSYCYTPRRFFRRR
jgi:hypothetical protein